MLYIARYAAHEPVGSMIAVGARLPAHATTMGRILLAYKPAAYIDEHFAEPLARFTERTPSTRAELDALLDADRARGYAISHSNFESGIASDDRFDTAVRDAVCEVARTISQLAGYRERVTA